MLRSLLCAAAAAPSFLPSIHLDCAPASAAAGSTTPSSIIPFLSVLGDHNEDDDADDDARNKRTVMT